MRGGAFLFIACINYAFYYKIPNELNLSHLLKVTALFRPALENEGAEFVPCWADYRIM